MIIQGIPASNGIAIEKVKLFKKEKLTIPDNKINDISAEIDKFEKARHSIIQKTQSLMAKAEQDCADDISEIMGAHKEILCDSSGFVMPVHDSISNTNINCSKAVYDVLSNMSDIFMNLDSEYMRERAADIIDIRDSIISEILGVSNTFILSSPSIVAAYDLAPSDTANLDFSMVSGLLTQVGGQTGHTAIIARTMGIPAVVGAKDILSILSDGQHIILDGTNGISIVNPTNEQLNEYQQNYKKILDQKNKLEAFKGKLTQTKDGRRIKLSANIGIDCNKNIIKDSDAEGIGLVRTEFLFMLQKSLPSASSQLKAYKSILEAANGNTVTFRTLDAGGDKELPSLNLEPEDNPFLGLRAVRISLKFQEIFKQQLKALFMASAHGNIRIMIPMISSCEEVDECMRIVSQVKKELTEQGIQYDKNVPVGMMIEVPAAAILAKSLSKKVDFFSTGTNDLIQYTVAVDRGNTEISHLYTPYHPSVIHLINNTISSAKAGDISCSMCGEAAGDTLMIPLLIGLGLNSFSVSPSEILSVRSQIAALEYNKCVALADEILSCSSASEVKKRIEKFMEDKNEKK